MESIRNPTYSAVIQLGVVTCKPLALIFISNGNKAWLDGSRNINASTANSDRGVKPLLEKPFSTMNPNGFININAGLAPPQLRPPKGPANLLGPVSIRPKIIPTPVLPLPSNTAELPGAISKRLKEWKSLLPRWVPPVITASALVPPTCVDKLRAPLLPTTWAMALADSPKLKPSTADSPAMRL